MPLPSRVSDLTGCDLLLSVAWLGSLGRAAAQHGIFQARRAHPDRFRRDDGKRLATVRAERARRRRAGINGGGRQVVSAAVDMWAR